MIHIILWGEAMFRSRFIRDTVLLTLMQLFLDTSALLLNVFITKRLGASGTGILALTGSFLGLAGILAGGNSFLCASRLVSEELGKRGGSPERVLRHGICFCMMLSTAVSCILCLSANLISIRISGGTGMAHAVRLMPFALIPGALSGCFKGYLNACRRSAEAAAVDVLEFILRSGVTAALVIASERPDEEKISEIMIGSIIAGNIFSLICCMAAYYRKRTGTGGSCSIGLRRYISLALPIMGGSILTSVLSSANDALIPLCLRQYGDSVTEALSRFGIFEAIVIPAIFFPSVVLCSIAGMIVSETARAAAAGDSERIKSIAERLTRWTLVYAVFSSSVLMRFGRQLGELLGGGETAGKLITLIAPVVPFIYMEIVLEAMIKGMGMQGFSSLNYLAEYAVRIAVVLIFVPLTGFSGVAASYYASNIIGNSSRFIRLKKAAKMKFSAAGMIAVPALYSFLTMGTAELLTRTAGLDTEHLHGIAVFVALWCTGYCAIFCLLGKVRVFDRKNIRLFVQN